MTTPANRVIILGIIILAFGSLIFGSWIIQEHNVQQTIIRKNQVLIEQQADEIESLKTKTLQLQDQVSIQDRKWSDDKEATTLRENRLQKLLTDMVEISKIQKEAAENLKIRVNQMQFSLDKNTLDVMSANNETKLLKDKYKNIILNLKTLAQRMSYSVQQLQKDINELKYRVIAVDNTHAQEQVYQPLLSQ